MWMMLSSWGFSSKVQRLFWCLSTYNTTKVIFPFLIALQLLLTCPILSVNRYNIGGIYPCATGLFVLYFFFLGLNINGKACLCSAVFMGAWKYIAKDVLQPLWNIPMYHYCTSTALVPPCTSAAPALVMVGNSTRLRRLRVLSAIWWLHAILQKEGIWLCAYDSI